MSFEESRKVITCNRRFRSVCCGFKCLQMHAVSQHHQRLSVWSSTDLSYVFATEFLLLFWLLELRDLRRQVEVSKLLVVLASCGSHLLC